MKVFITGVTGFIGQHLWEHFTPEDEIYVLVRNPTWKPIAGLERLNVNVIKGDLAGTEVWFSQLEKIRPEVCIHLAWQGIPDFSFYQCHWNLSASANMFRHLVEKCGCKKIISTGSCFEYGMCAGEMYEDEDCKLNSYFTWAKHSLMEFGMMLKRKHGIRFNWLRPFYIYGPGQRSESLIPKITHNLRSDAQTTLKSPHVRNDYIHVKDVAEILVQMARVDYDTGIYNIGTGHTTSTWTICRLIEEELGMEHDSSKFAFDSDADLSANALFAGIEKIKCETNWYPKISIEEGILDYVKKSS